jgi:hypothetical protein
MSFYREMRRKLRPAYALPAPAGTDGREHATTPPGENNRAALQTPYLAGPPATSVNAF